MDTAQPPERKRRRAPDENRPADVVTWTPGGKMKEIERWTASVIADDQLPSAAKSAAWVLSFGFSSEPDARSWERRELTAARYGLNLNTFKQSLQWLERRGHIVRRLERVPRMKKPVQVTRPAIPKGVVVPYPMDYHHVAVPHLDHVATPHPCIPSTDPETNPSASEDSLSGRPCGRTPIKCEECYQDAEAHYRLGETHFYRCWDCGEELRDTKGIATVETY